MLVSTEDKIIKRKIKLLNSYKYVTIYSKTNNAERI